MKLVSWNVNGFRAVLGKNFAQVFAEMDADVFCIQETKMQPGQAEFAPEGYFQYWFSAQRKGYSGTAVYTKREPLAVVRGIGREEFDCEGRAITLEFPEFYLVNAYVPNSQEGLARIDFRVAWEDAVRAYLLGLDAQKPVVYCGDFNVAHEDIDLKNPDANRGVTGFSDAERGKLDELLESGFTDTFRALYPDRGGIYTWWSYFRRGRATNAGWRIDYFLVSNRLRPQVADAMIYDQILGSDHCPIGLELRL